MIWLERSDCVHRLRQPQCSGGACQALVIERTSRKPVVSDAWSASKLAALAPPATTLRLICLRPRVLLAMALAMRRAARLPAAC